MSGIVERDDVQYPVNLWPRKCAAIAAASGWVYDEAERPELVLGLVRCRRMEKKIMVGPDGERGFHVTLWNAPVW